MASARPHRKSRDRPAPRVSAVLGLQKVELFRGLDPVSLREIGQHCKWSRRKKNEYVIRRGDGTDRDVYFVISGLVRVAAPAGRGRNIIFRDVAAGDFFGEHSALDGLNRFADVVAVRESLLASMPPEACNELRCASMHPPAAAAVARSARLTQANGYSIWKKKTNAGIIARSARLSLLSFAMNDVSARPW